MADYEMKYAPRELSDLMLAITNQHYPHLGVFDIRLCMVPKAWKRSEKIVLAQARAGSVRERVLFGVHGWVEIAEEIWGADPSLMSPELQEAVLDHELSHFRVKDTVVEGVQKLVTVPHDFEDFIAVVQRRGLYREELKALGVVVGEQLGEVESI